MGQYYNVPYAYQYQPYTAPAYAAPAYAAPAYAYAAPAPVMRPEDAAAVNELGAEGIATGKKALNIASNLAKNVFPATGPIINGAGAIQTKWGNYQLANRQDADVVEKLLDVTRDLLARIPIVDE